MKIDIIETYGILEIQALKELDFKALKALPVKNVIINAKSIGEFTETEVEELIHKIEELNRLDFFVCIVNNRKKLIIDDEIAVVLPSVEECVDAVFMNDIEKEFKL